MLITCSLEEYLTDKYHQYDWFHSAGFNEHGRAVLYVKYMNSKVFSELENLNRFVLVHFASSLLASAQQYKQNLSRISDYQPVEKSVEIDIHEELWKLQRVCGRENLIHIFYEVHDQNDAVTNVSQQFPEVRKAMDILYADAGFDVLFDQLNPED